MAETNGAVLDNLQIKATGNVQDAVAKLDQLIAKLNALKGASTTAATGQKTLEKESKSTTKTLKETSKAASHAADGVSKLASAIARVAFYRVIRSAIKAVTSAFKEGTENAYKWAVANNDAFAGVMDTYATRVNYLKNTMGALASTVLTAFLPVFQQITNVVIQAANAVSAFIAALTGGDSYLKAREVVVKYGDALDDAARKQKKMIQLMSFDELNNITTPSSGGGNDDIENWEDAFFRDNVDEKTKALAENFKRIFDSIPWEKIKESVLTIVDKLTPVIVDFWNQHGSDLIDFITEIHTQFLPAALDLAIAVAPVLALLLRVLAAFTYAKLMPLLKLINNTSTHITDLITSIFSFDIAGSVRSIALLIVDIIEWIFTSVSERIRAIMKLLSKIPGLGFLGDAADEVSGKFDNFFAKVKAGIDDTYNSFKKLESVAASSTSLSRIERAQIAAQNAVFNGASESEANKIIDRAILYEAHDNKMKDLLGYADGGFPFDMGSVFVAGEVPGSAEMVGTINGRTGVASGEEITGIASAVYATGNEEADLLRQILGAIRSGGNSRPNAAFGRFASQSIALYKGVTG